MDDDMKMVGNTEIIIDLVNQRLLEEYKDLRSLIQIMEKQSEGAPYFYQEEDRRYLAAFESVLEYYNGSDWKETFNIV